MPHVDQDAKSWEMKLSGRVGAAVQARRKALKLTALQLAERTKELGYPITRVAISKIETNTRAGKFDVAELLVLAVALEIPPALLLFPGYPDLTAELIPGLDGDSYRAVAWLSGMRRMPPKTSKDGTVEWMPGNTGVDLVDLVYGRAQHDSELFLLGQNMAQDAPPDVVESTKRLIRHHEEKLADLTRRIGEVRAELWGTAAEDESDG